jgi:hypothetical protein
VKTAGPNALAVFMDAPVNTTPYITIAERLLKRNWHQRNLFITEKVNQNLKLTNKWQASNVRPIPTGAKKVDLCFSQAKKRTDKTKAAVSIASMNTPWALVVPAPTPGVMASGPGSRTFNNPLATICSRRKGRDDGRWVGG